MLANGDVTKVEDIESLNCHKFAFWASYLIEKKKIEHKKQ